MGTPNVRVVAADTNGRIRGVGAGRKAMIQPSGIAPGSIVGLTALIGVKQTPMDWPATSGIVDLEDDFQELQFTGCTPSGTYLVGTFPAGSEGYKSTGSKSNQVANAVGLGDALAMAQAAPSGTPATSIPVYPSWQQWNLSLSGTPQAVSLWQQDQSGNWFFVEQLCVAGDWDASNTLTISRGVAFGGGRIYFRAGGAGTTFSLDVAYQVGG